MTTPGSSITIRQCLQKLGLATQDELYTHILSLPTFLAAWAEFRDDFLWGPVIDSLSGHIFLKTVVPATLRELAQPSGFYVRRPGSSNNNISETVVDKTPFNLSDHYVRLLLLVIPALVASKLSIFHGHMDTDEGRQAALASGAYGTVAARGESEDI
ncbi:hypothetical protein SLS58_009101 [Diplodia intermedia]|uniref:Uncharacterized protein n=1 Tax=Diplodia intermedia TaxID=856260 RepID=A0ABR3TEK1_9PEZI